MEATEMTRLDILVMRQSGFSREYSREIIEKGLVSAGGKTLMKPGAKLPADTALTIAAEQMKYVSRGGYKLEKAVAVFGVSVHNSICLDIGASTGGFTDCLLQAGARKVYAVDAGTEQLAESLRGDSRVVSMENTNIRAIAPGSFAEAADVITIDVSFISLTKVLPHITEFLAADGAVICLVKPQFEAGKGNVGKRGVVSDPKVHLAVLKELYRFAPSCGLQVCRCDSSPIRGQNGNKEYLLLLRKADGLAEKLFLTAAKTAVAAPDEPPRRFAPPLQGGELFPCE